jgi:hypothetical protein
VPLSSPWLAGWPEPVGLGLGREYLQISQQGWLQIAEQAAEGGLVAIPGLGERGPEASPDHPASIGSPVATRSRNRHFRTVPLSGGRPCNARVGTSALITTPAGVRQLAFRQLAPASGVSPESRAARVCGVGLPARAGHGTLSAWKYFL